MATANPYLRGRQEHQATGGDQLRRKRGRILGQDAGNSLRNHAGRRRRAEARDGAQKILAGCGVDRRIADHKVGAAGGTHRHLPGKLAAP
jgi:hypothetical protein